MKHRAMLFITAAFVLVHIDVATAHFGGGKGKYCEQATAPQQPNPTPPAVFNPVSNHWFCPNRNVPWTNARCVPDTTHPAFLCGLVEKKLPSREYFYILIGDDNTPSCQPPTGSAQSADAVSTSVLVCAPNSVGPDGKPVPPVP
jgi:hypothetical protein